MVASARSFIPHTRVPIADVPTPSSRPYDLGEDDGQGGGAPSDWNLRTTTSRQMAPSEVTVRARTAPPALSAPVVARRQASPVFTSAIPPADVGVSSGRGLY
jgi:hypothetical protein